MDKDMVVTKDERHFLGWVDGARMFDGYIMVTVENVERIRQEYGVDYKPGDTVNVPFIERFA